MKTLTVVLSLPPRELAPNARFHWGAKSRVRKKRRADVGMIALSMCKGSPPKWIAATVQPTFYVKDRRGLARDGDNSNAQLKSDLDGLADAGIVENDRCFTLLPPRIEIDHETPRLQLEITEIAP